MIQYIKDIFGSICVIAEPSIEALHKELIPLSTSKHNPYNQLEMPECDIQIIGTKDLNTYLIHSSFRVQILEIMVMIFKKFWEHKVNSINKDGVCHIPSVQNYLSYSVQVINTIEYNKEELLSFFVIYNQISTHDFLSKETAYWEQFNFYNAMDINYLKVRFKKQIIDPQINLIEGDKKCIKL